MEKVQQDYAYFDQLQKRFESQGGFSSNAASSSSAGRDAYDSYGSSSSSGRDSYGSSDRYGSSSGGGYGGSYDRSESPSNDSSGGSRFANYY